MNGAVDARLRGEINDDIRLPHERAHKGLVRDVPLHEAITPRIEPSYVGGISRVGERIEINDARIRNAFENAVDEIRSHEPASPAHQKPFSGELRSASRHSPMILAHLARGRHDRFDPWMFRRRADFRISELQRASMLARDEIG